MHTASDKYITFLLYPCLYDLQQYLAKGDLSADIKSYFEGRGKAFSAFPSKKAFLCLMI